MARNDFGNHAGELCNVRIAFLVGVHCATVATSPVVPFGPDFRAKRDPVSVYQDRVEVMTIGASHLESSFVPPVSEAQFGIPLSQPLLSRSPGHRMQEVWREILDARPPQWKSILIDIAAWPENMGAWEKPDGAWWREPRGAPSPSSVRRPGLSLNLGEEAEGR